MLWICGIEKADTGSRAQLFAQCTSGALLTAPLLIGERFFVTPHCRLIGPYLVCLRCRGWDFRVFRHFLPAFQILAGAVQF